MYALVIKVVKLESLPPDLRAHGNVIGTADLLLHTANVIGTTEVIHPNTTLALTGTRLGTTAIGIVNDSLSVARSP